MNLSRRGFLKASAAVPAVISTGGASAVPAVAAITETVGGSSMGSMISATVIEKLAGKYPYNAIKNIMGYPFWRSQVNGGHDALHARILGSGDLLRHDKSPTWYSEKMRFLEDIELYTQLARFPQNVPLMTLLSNEVYIDMAKNDVANGRPSEASAPTPHDIIQLRDMLSPVCNENTTAADLLQTYSKYMMRLAKHSLDCPQDFTTHGQSRSSADEIKVHSDMDFISDFIQKFGLGGEENADLVSKLREKRKEYTETLKPKYLGETQELQEIEKRERLEHKENLKIQIEDRCTRIVSLADMGNGVFNLQLCDITLPIPQHVDWLHFVQKIDPANAKASDVVLNDTGLLVTFNNQSVLDHIAKIHKTRARVIGQALTPFIDVELPNRRAGADLNSQREITL